MDFYQRKLPHWQPRGAEYFITFRLVGSLPRSAIAELKGLRKECQDLQESTQNSVQRKIFQKYEQILDKTSDGPLWLKKLDIAQVVQEAMHYRDSKLYDLFAYCIMANHVHVVFEHLDNGLSKGSSNNLEKNFPITDIMRELKRYTAYECNKILGRKGAFWQSESYDRVIRDQEELESTIRYTLNNPVKAGLVRYWEDWPYSYCKPEFVETFKSFF